MNLLKERNVIDKLLLASKFVLPTINPETNSQVRTGNVRKTWWGRFKRKKRAVSVSQDEILLTEHTK